MIVKCNVCILHTWKIEMPKGSQCFTDSEPRALHPELRNNFKTQVRALLTRYTRKDTMNPNLAYLLLKALSMALFLPKLRSRSPESKGTLPPKKTPQNPKNPCSGLWGRGFWGFSRQAHVSPTFQRTCSGLTPWSAMATLSHPEEPS